MRRRRSLRVYRARDLAPDPMATLAQHYRDRADVENIFDELKNQWGWGGLPTTFTSSKPMARVIGSRAPRNAAEKNTKKIKKNKPPLRGKERAKARVSRIFTPPTRPATIRFRCRNSCAWSSSSIFRDICLRYDRDDNRRLRSRARCELNLQAPCERFRYDSLENFATGTSPSDSVLQHGRISCVSRPDSTNLRRLLSRDQVTSRNSLPMR